MIRFQPDTLSQAFMRFFDMAAPDANVYIEIAAPDIRFASIVVLALAAVLCWQRLGPGRRATAVMVAVLLLSSVFWLSTTGNGRYFMPLLVCAGPISIGLTCALPLTRALKGTLALVLLTGQIFVLSQQPPWNTWTYLHWKDGPYFEVNLGPEETRGPATTYATLSLITYSLIAPQFARESRWVSVTTAASERDRRMTDDFLRESASRGPMRVMAPSLPWASLPDGRPTQGAIDAMEELLTPRNLHISGDCRYLGSPALVMKAQREHGAYSDESPPPGFWSCPIAYEHRPPDPHRLLQPPDAVRRVFLRLAEMCPRFFPVNESGILRLRDAWLRHYGNSETRVYVLDRGEVWYKFWRSMNPVLVGSVGDLLTGNVTIDCAAIRGSDGAWRSGAR